MNAQNTVSGSVTDAETGETLIGVNILVQNTSSGNITDFDGNYTMQVSEELPYTLVFSLIGYGNEVIEVTTSNAVINVQLATESILANEVVVSASRVEESILQSPVSVEKIGIQEIKTTAAPDFYDEINNMKGVTRAQASLTFNTINTRGFATAGNTRFVQLQDGIDNAAPLLNFPTGNVVGISELDIKEVELVPGAASALYGPNAFNGILFMNSKDPWEYQGLSAQLKGGVTDGTETNPLYGFSVRYADDINDKFAYKFNVSTFFATDWIANNYDTHISSRQCETAGVGNACFNGWNTYGDETVIPIGSGITRTGFTEADLIDNNDATSIKLDAALHYKINDKLETNVSFRHGTGSTVYQGSERYALRDFTQQFAKWELNGPEWNIRAYGSFTDDGDSYNMSALGAFANEGNFHTIGSTDYTLNLGGQEITIPISTGWAVAANLAYNGAFSLTNGIPGGNEAAAKEFADLGGTAIVNQAAWPAIAAGLGPVLFGEALPGLPSSVYTELAMQVLAGASGNPQLDPNDPNFASTIEAIRTGLFQRGGAGFIDDSKMYHVEGNYDFTEKLNNVIGLQMGANFRRYSLYTEGTIFREWNADTQTYERIGINEWGAYMQASKTFAEKLKLTGSIRYDKNQNFDGQFSPRLSAVYSIDDRKKHNIRASWQTGFRNPTTQGQYIFFPASQVLLGGTEENASITNELDGSTFNIFEPGNALALDGETSLDLDYVQPEKLTAIEVGYKAVFGKNTFFDIAYYRNQYKGLY